MRKTTILFSLLFIASFTTAQSDLLTTLLSDPDKLRLINQKLINTPELEFSPAYYGERIVYVANGRKDPKLADRSTTNYYNLYAAMGADDTLLYGEQPLSAQLNSPYHEGPLCFTRNLDTIYFTRNNQLESANPQKIKRLSIFMAYYTPDGWSKPLEILGATDQYSFCHPAVNTSGDRLYFTSNLPGGYGNYDLYYIEKKESGWSSPINMGAEINSTENELFPTLLNNNILCYSSNRSGGFGGLDIYISLRSNENFDTPIRLGMPLNSIADDLGLVLAPDGKNAYLSSNRPGGVGQDDIYLLTWKNDIALTPKSVQIVVLNKDNKKRLGNVALKIQNSANREEINSLITDREGIAHIDLMPGDNYIFQINNTLFDPFFEVIPIDGKTIYLNVQPKSCFTISGVAIDNENKERISGSSIYLFNSCQGTVDSTVSDPLGKFKFCLPPGCYGKILGKQAGFHDVSIPLDSLKSDLLLNLNFEKIKVSILKEPVKKGSVITLENIYYDFNQYKIRPGAERELNELITVMQQYPGMQVKLVAHTDTRGPESTNLSLSVKRAESAKNYLIANGIAASRIQIEGRGETQPRNRCKNGVNCTEDEHQFNRRTEVVVLKME